MCNGPPVCAKLRFSSLRCNVDVKEYWRELLLAYGGRVSWDVARDEALELKVPDQQDRRRGLDAMVFPPTEG